MLKEVILTGIFSLIVLCSQGQLDFSRHVVPVYESNESTTLGIYDTSPENSNGNYVCFTRYQEIAKGGHLATPVAASLMLKNRVTGKIRKIYDVTCNNHNGVNALWVNDSLLAFQITDFRDFVIYNVNKDHVEFGPIQGELPHKSFGTTLFFSISNARLLVLDPSRKPYAKDREGIYAMDIVSGNITLVKRLEEITSSFTAQNPQVKKHETKLLHVEPNPANDKILFDYRFKNETDQNSVSLQGFMYANGNGIRWVTERPMHVVWFDNNTMFGVDTKDPEFKIARYDLFGGKMELLGGISTHVGASPDRKWYVGEAGFYKPEKDGFTRVYLYKRGIKQPYALLAQWKNSKITWDWVAHVNPSFSADGNRVYFVRASDTNDRFEAVSIDLSKLEAYQ